MPKEIRATLNERLHNGERNDLLVEWLNAQKEVQEVLAAQFEGRPITEQNLSEWKTGGFKDWERNEISKELVRAGKEESDSLDDAALGAEISDCSARLLSAEILALQREMLGKEMPVEERWKLVCQLHKQISKMRKDDHRSVRTILQQEKWEQEQEDREAAAEKQFSEDFKKSEEEREKRLNAPLLARYDVPSLAEMYGGGKGGWKKAARQIELARGLPLGILQERKGGKWQIVDNDWAWVETKDEGRMKKEEGKGRKTPKSKSQAPKKQQKPKSKAVKGQKKSAPMVKRAKGFGRDAQNNPRDAGATRKQIDVRPDANESIQTMSIGGQETAATPPDPTQSDLIEAKNSTAVGKSEDGGLRMEDGGEAKPPSSKHQSPEQPQAPHTKVVEGPEVYDGIAASEQAAKDDGSSVASPHHEGIEASTESRSTDVAGVKRHNNPPPRIVEVGLQKWGTA